MKINEINPSHNEGNFLSKYPAKSHYKFIMQLGRVMPTCKAQAKHFNTLNTLDVLSKADAVEIAELMIKHGYEADFKYTKSKTWVRLQNLNDFKKSLLNEYK